MKRPLARKWALILPLAVLAAPLLLAQQPRPRPRPAPSVAPIGPAAPRTDASLLIVVDAPAQITLDGERLGQVEANQAKRVPVSLGQHLVQAVHAAQPGVQGTIEVEVKGPGQVIVRIELASRLVAPGPAAPAAPRAPPSSALAALPWVRIPGGSFQMGCVADGEPGTGGGIRRWTDQDCWDNEKPSHLVTLTRSFELLATEVTVGQFRAFADGQGYRTTAESEGWSRLFTGQGREQATGISWRVPGFAQDDRHPVVHVSWDDAVAFCRAAGGRLPTEAEWEYAARGAVAGLRYLWGSGPPVVKAANVGDEAAKRQWTQWPFGISVLRGYDDGFAYTAPVRSYVANGFGLYDMAGNAMEWVADYHDENYYQVSPGADPAGPLRGEERVVRGGSWVSVGSGLLASSRSGSAPDVRSNDLGFRCARDVSP